MGDPEASGTSPVPSATGVSGGWHAVEELLAVRLDNVGDVVMLGPALRALRQGLPSARITLMASPAGALVAPLLPWVDSVMVERVVWQDASGGLALDPDRELELVARIADRRFDAALIFTSFSQSPWPPAYACYLAGVPVRAGQAADFGGSLLNRVVAATDRETHQVDRNLHLLEGLGFPVVDRRLEVDVPPEAAAVADRLLGQLGLAPDQPFVALAPGASCAARRYPAERFSAVADQLARARLPVVVVGRTGEEDLAGPILQANGGRGVWSLVGRTGVAELAAVIARAAVVVANDSGPMHLADGLERPLVVLFSGTDLESQWRPRRSPTRLLRRPTPCSPCYRFDCPFDLACLDIPPEEVVEHVLDLVEAPESIPRPSSVNRSGGLCVGSGS